MRRWIEVTIMQEFGRTESIRMEIDSVLAEQIFKTEELSEDPFAQVFHGNANLHDVMDRTITRKRDYTLKLRSSAAKHLADVISKKLVELFGARDLANGYPRESQDDRRGQRG